MNETHVTVQGYAGSEVNTRAAAGTLVASFRLACTPRRLNRRTNEWSDAPTQWYTVTAWRNLGANVAGSIRKGDAVYVSGRLSVHTWIKDGMEQVSYEIDAEVIGHDLARGTSNFRKNVRELRERPREESAGDQRGDDYGRGEQQRGDRTPTLGDPGRTAWQPEPATAHDPWAEPARLGTGPGAPDVEGLREPGSAPVVDGQGETAA